MSDPSILTYSGIRYMNKALTDQQIKILSERPQVKCVSRKTGLHFSKEFLDQLKEAWSEQKSLKTIESFLEANGFTSDLIPRSFLYCLQRRLKDKWAEKEKQVASDNSSIENTGKTKYDILSSFAGHPLIVKGVGFHYNLSDEFFNDACRLHHLGFSMEQILGVYEIDSSVISLRTLNSIRKKLTNWKKTEVSSKLTDEQHCRYARNKSRLLEDKVSSLFSDIKTRIPSMTRIELKEFCRFIDALPTDNAQGYGKKELIELCGMSKTRYYRILSDESYVIREELRNSRDDVDVAKIRQVLERFPFPMGIRQIFMQMPRVTGVSFSLNKLRRLMKKYGITCPVRRPRNTNRVKREWLKEHVKPNLLRRRFRLHRPGEVILTDVTYLTYAHGIRRAYGSSAIDPVTGKLLTFCISERNDLALGLDTLTKLSEIPGLEPALLHSDQGILYLTDEFQNRVKEMRMTQSMSKRGNCWDNSPQESFFGHFKDEVLYEDCTSFEELKKLIDLYSVYYNDERCQWTRNRMTPVEYEKYLREMTEEEFSGYLENEERKYRQMQEASVTRAKLRARTLGPE